MSRANGGDWFYGATACFPKAVEWHAWFEHWKERYEASQPIEKFLVDATVKLQQTYIRLCQKVRKNDNWTRNYAEDEMATILDIVGEADAWFKRNRPREDQIEALDPRLKFICQALGGSFAVAVALGQELDQINRKGFVVVNAADEHHELRSPNA